MSERKITTLLLMGFGAAVTAMFEILYLFLDTIHVVFLALGVISALLMWVLFYLDDIKKGGKP